MVKLRARCVSGPCPDKPRRTDLARAGLFASEGFCLREHGRGKDNSGGGEHDGEADEHGFLPKDKP